MQESPSHFLCPHLCTLSHFALILHSTLACCFCTLVPVLSRCTLNSVHCTLVSLSVALYSRLCTLGCVLSTLHSRLCTSPTSHLSYKHVSYRRDDCADWRRAFLEIRDPKSKLSSTCKKCSSEFSRTLSLGLLIGSQGHYFSGHTSSGRIFQDMHCRHGATLSSDNTALG